MPVPRGAGGFGQANIYYPYNHDGSSRLSGSKKNQWMVDAISYVHKYEGANLLTDPIADTVHEVEVAFENTSVQSDGQGIRVDAETRKAIEQHAVKKAITYFRKKGYVVADVGATHSYDLYCVKGRKVLHAEVKGTQSKGHSIQLTTNEVKNAKNNKVALFVVHSIKVEKQGRKIMCRGGVTRIFDPWFIGKQGSLKPIAYSYTLEKES